MNKRVVILPFDGYPHNGMLLEVIQNTLSVPGISDLVAYVKLNDGVHNPDQGGPEIVAGVKKLLQEMKLPIGVFLDLKLYDVSATVKNTLKKYAQIGVDILTVSSNCSVAGIAEVRKLLPGTKLAMVSVLTDMSREECLTRYGQAPEVKIYNDVSNIEAIYQKEVPTALYGKFNSCDLIVCSPLELPFLRRNLPYDVGFIVPGIRDKWMKQSSEHQKRTTGVREALNNGATFVVMGAQLNKGNPELEISARDSQIFTLQEIEKASPNLISNSGTLATLKNCQGYYESRLGPEGYLGPVVGYAKKYIVDEKTEKNMVGFIYLNFSKAEQYPAVCDWFAELIVKELGGIGGGMRLKEIDVVLGAPLGGIFLAKDIGRRINRRTIFAEKIVTTASDPNNNVREKSHLSLDRHEIRRGDLVVISEDVVNNFTTTEELKTLIESQGGELIGITCAFNRSGQRDWNGIPVISALEIALKQYRQDDPAVATLIAEGKIILKPKLSWPELEAAMTEE